MKHQYSVEAGRQIYKDGKPWLFISGNRDSENNMMRYDPCEADALVHVVADLLNEGYAFTGSKGMPPFKWIKNAACECSLCWQAKYKKGET